MIDKKDNREIIILNEAVIGSSAFVMKELILRGYRIMAISPSCGKVEVECYKHDALLNTQKNAVRREEYLKGGLRFKND